MNVPLLALQAWLSVHIVLASQKPVEGVRCPKLLKLPNMTLTNDGYLFVRTQSTFPSRLSVHALSERQSSHATRGKIPLNLVTKS